MDDVLYHGFGKKPKNASVKLECENCNKQAAIWFKKGQMSVKRKNESGCICVIDDNDQVISVCGAHKDWIEQYRCRCDD